MKTAFFHQAHFLPWPGYIARCLDPDLVIFLDDVKFNKGYYHNRCKIINCQGTETWLTMPINNKTRSSSLQLVNIAEGPLFKKWFRGFRLAYQYSQEFDEIWELLQRSFEDYYPNLDKFNRHIIIWIIDKVCGTLGRNVPTYENSSTFTTSATDKSQRLLSISQLLGVKRILMGADSFRVHDIVGLAKNGIISVRHVHCSDPLSGKTTGILPPPSGVTFLHHVLTDGWEKPSLQLLNDWGIAHL